MTGAAPVVAAGGEFRGEGVANPGGIAAEVGRVAVLAPVGRAGRESRETGSNVVSSVSGGGSPVGERMGDDAGRVAA